MNLFLTRLQRQFIFLTITSWNISLSIKNSVWQKTKCKILDILLVSCPAQKIKSKLLTMFHVSFRAQKIKSKLLTMILVSCPTIKSKLLTMFLVSCPTIKSKLLTMFQATFVMCRGGVVLKTWRSPFWDELDVITALFTGHTSNMPTTPSSHDQNIFRVSNRGHVTDYRGHVTD